MFQYPVTLKYTGTRIEFTASPFALKDEIKAMAGARWHGFEEKNPRKIWSVKDCPRNRLQLRYMQGENVYELFDRPLVEHQYDRPLHAGQRLMTDSFLTRHFQIAAAEMGLGKTLAAQELIERSIRNSKFKIQNLKWIWIGPKTSIPNIEAEFRKWDMPREVRDCIELLTYDGFVKFVDNWNPASVAPVGLIFDEAHLLKNPTSQRSVSAQFMADQVRYEHGDNGYVILLTGTPAPQDPTDWWSLCEICYPGFLKEGSKKALEQRLGYFAPEDYGSGVFNKRFDWRNDDRKCAHCGDFEDAPQHDHGDEAFHDYEPGRNEVSYLYERMKGLVLTLFKKDYLDFLPEKRYRTIRCKPKPSTLRAAKVIHAASPNAISSLTRLRELSDGFQYRDVEDGMVPCDHCKATGVVHEIDDEVVSFQCSVFSNEDHELKTENCKLKTVPCPQCDGTKKMIKWRRETRQVPCPKTEALRELLDKANETGRIVIFAGFTGAIDRVVDICHKDGWDVVRCDGRGFKVKQRHGLVVKAAPLDYWKDRNNERVAFVAHPESGGTSFTLVEAQTCVYWSNSFKGNARSQSEDRVHRPGMDLNKGCEIIDLVHLPSDELVIENLKAKRKLEKMTLGEVETSFATAT
jgi:SNF2 family DNA or RNA helicase